MSLPASNPEPEKTRGGCLSVFLFAMFILNPAIGLYYLLAGSTLAAMVPGMELWSVHLLGGLALVNFALALAVWRWKKAGVYGFCASALIIFGINMGIGLPVTQCMIGLLGPIILVLLIKNKWSQFE